MKIVNKKALHEYHILESFEAGVQLFGSEVKSIRSGRIDLGQSFARIINEEAFLVNANIPRYQNAPIKDYDPQRTRRLLLHKSQIQSLIGKLQAKVTLVPVAIYEKNNLIKVQLGLAKSKKEFDKRKIIKERDHHRRIEQELRGKE
ncbi:SsrA-binding protein [Candidatus Daviesbacteria bacterium RIFCSPLOWO2_01_FULL_43_38]|uniref:SsrA-binding protein n=1 Tax=Candidatus Daviesbacteria bacterium RIFCSPHIGHO2_12_FULL_43_11 TaxID=1797780 RepID=A0A1F5K3C7_9BACT|nr:MAG: SsrA-binding protein [Candidatus Daviesbacteria bacterium RIFCSPHIGHO2_01_FULL_43_17]OGE35268.1 MAG: SsrA-binding protein [Candidatus Daviesbacteria bacterium RIFCSPHIGHO2_12_FULL_43_11]OGE63388.1 MAG: SsrA-binding protein [Candidatus Daviesbacteria bacterium RIFCSPLOWO2_01_FULL_43_38]OGE69233.1 MAG: SsrA-binding protein [Candidatus Daviesbacteria bacterium RIFCSPLOWO2_02_FULL_43_11]